MYPTAVIVLVALQKSHLDHQFTYPPTTHEHPSEIESLPFTVKTCQPKHGDLRDTVDMHATASTGYGYERDASMAARVVALRAQPVTVASSDSIWEAGKDSSMEGVQVGLAA